MHLAGFDGVLVLFVECAEHLLVGAGVFSGLLVGCLWIDPALDLQDGRVFITGPSLRRTVAVLRIDIALLEVRLLDYVHVGIHHLQTVLRQSAGPRPVISNAFQSYSAT